MSRFQMPIGSSCGFCRFSCRGNNVAPGAVLVCKRNPPAPMFPIVDPTDYCWGYFPESGDINQIPRLYLDGMTQARHF
jgi:hypothetical protein